MRTFKRCVKQLKKYIIKPYNADVFISTWDDPGVNHGLISMNKNSKISEKILNRYYSPVDINIESFKDEYFNHLHGVSLPDELKQYDYINSRSALPLYYHIYKCNKLKLSYEKLNSFKYDIVIRIRPDLFISEKILSLTMFKNYNEKDTLYMSDYAIDSSYQLSDKFAFASSAIMDVYSSVFSSLSDYWKYPLGDNKHWKNYRVGERLMKYHIEKNDLKYKLFHSSCFIYRNRISLIKNKIQRINKIYV